MRTRLVHQRKCFTMTYVKKQFMAQQHWSSAPLPVLRARRTVGIGRAGLSCVRSMFLDRPSDGRIELGEPGVCQAFERIEKRSLQNPQT